VTSPANFFDWQEQNSVFEGMAAFNDTRNTLSSDGEPEEVPAQITTDNLFSVLGVNAMLGRTFTPEDGKPGQNDVVVISNGLWQRRFGSDPNVIGRTVILNAVEHTVIGVLPPDVNWHVRKNSQTGRAANSGRKSLNAFYSANITSPLSRSGCDRCRPRIRHLPSRKSYHTSVSRCARDQAISATRAWRDALEALGLQSF
jgi:hypothetical protein